MKKFLNSNRGVTLLDLTIYMIAIALVIGIMTSIRAFFFQNLGVVKETAKYAATFDSFNANFVKDVKDSEDVVIQQENNNYLISFSNGVVYQYITPKEGGTDQPGMIYRNSVQIATNIQFFGCEKSTVYIQGIQKNLLKLNIAIGDTEKNVFMKKMQYTLRYW